MRAAYAASQKLLTFLTVLAGSHFLMQCIASTCTIAAAAQSPLMQLRTAWALLLAWHEPEVLGVFKTYTKKVAERAGWQQLFVAELSKHLHPSVGGKGALGQLPLASQRYAQPGVCCLNGLSQQFRHLQAIYTNLPAIYKPVVYKQTFRPYTKTAAAEDVTASILHAPNVLPDCHAS